MSDEPTKLDVDLLEDGLLWLINTVVFHPRGFALGYGDDGSFELWGNGDEPWSYSETVDTDAKFRAAEAAMARVRS